MYPDDCTLGGPCPPLISYPLVGDSGISIELVGDSMGCSESIWMSSKENSVSCLDFKNEKSHLDRTIINNRTFDVKYYNKIINAVKATTTGVNLNHKHMEHIYSYGEVPLSTPP